MFLNFRRSRAKYVQRSFGVEVELFELCFGKFAAWDKEKESQQSTPPFRIDGLGFRSARI